MESDRPTNVYEFLDEIRPRLGMYVGEPTLQNLETYLHGYCAALGVHGLEEDGTPNFGYFLKWLMRRLETPGGWACGWAHGIMNRCDGDSDAALNLFFDLASEFGSLRQHAGDQIEVPNGHSRSKDWLELNSHHADLPLPDRIQLMHLKPGDWTFARYWYGDKLSDQWDLHSSPERAMKSIQWEFDIETKNLQNKPAHPTAGNVPI